VPAHRLTDVVPPVDGDLTTVSVAGRTLANCGRSAVDSPDPAASPTSGRAG
jgi:hypothetical protein